MIDFTDCEELLCSYGGSEKKKKIIYKGNNYLLKFPDPVRDKSNKLSYVNNVFSEYVGCKIFKECGIKTQEVLLGTYTEKKKAEVVEKIVVACLDFVGRDNLLIEFSSLANSVTFSDKHYSADIVDIYEILEGLKKSFNGKLILEHFWDMFVLDTLVGNVDRHLSNWGLLFNVRASTGDFAPIYDCGSSLHPLLSDEEMEHILEDSVEFKNVTYNIYSVYRYDGKKIPYKDFYKMHIQELDEAVLRMVPKINLSKIYQIIDDIECMASIRKEFLKKSIEIRKTAILDVSYHDLKKGDSYA